MKMRGKVVQQSHRPIRNLDMRKEETPFVWSKRRKMALEHPIACQALLEQYHERIKALIQWCDANEILIGNIKLFLEGPSGFSTWLTTTGDEIRIEGACVQGTGTISEYQEYFTAIIFGKQKNELPKKLNELIHTLDFNVRRWNLGD